MNNLTAGTAHSLCQAVHGGGTLYLPCRVFLRDKAAQLLFSDYLLVDEEASDSLYYLKSTLSLSEETDENDLIYVENPFQGDSMELSKLVNAAKAPVPSSLEDSGGKLPSNYLPLVMLAVGVLIVIIAMVVATLNRDQ